MKRSDTRTAVVHSLSLILHIVNLSAPVCRVALLVLFFVYILADKLEGDQARKRLTSVV